MEAKTWEETVMSIEEMNQVVLDNLDLPMGQAITKVQAKISFKVGRDEGRKEVVFIVLNMVEDLQVKLKEWGIE